MDQYVFHGYQRRFPEYWNTAANDVFLLSLPLNDFNSRIRFLFFSDKPLMFEISVEQYK